MPAALPLLAIADPSANASPSTGERATAEEWAAYGKGRSAADRLDSALDVWVDLVKYVTAAMRSGGCNTNSEPTVVDDGSTRVCEFEDDLHFCKFYAQMAICASVEITVPPETSITVRVRARLDEDEPGGYSSQLMQRHRQLAMQSSSDAVSVFGLTLGLILGHVVFHAAAWTILFCLLLMLCTYSFNLVRRAGDRNQIAKEHANEAKRKLLEIVQKNLNSDAGRKATAFWTYHRERVTSALLEVTEASKVVVKDAQFLPSFVPTAEDRA